MEGLTISSDGKKLYTLLQSATRQDGGSNAATRRYTRLLQYGLSPDSPTPAYEAECVDLVSDDEGYTSGIDTLLRGIHSPMGEF